MRQSSRKIGLHAAVMDRYDPEKRIGLIVDEWGTWFQVEPDTNPGFLYQQNTMRDAMVASVTLDIFNRRCDRVHMTNIAQTVNVLQAIILTEGDRMVLTPTYHVFDLYKAHMDAKAIDCYVEAEETGSGKHRLPSVTASASEKDGKVTLTVSNLEPEKAQEITVSLRGEAVRSAEGRILTGKMNTYNDFENAPLAVQEYTDFEVKSGELVLRMPACSVAEIRL